MGDELVEAFSHKLGGDELETSKLHPRLCEFKSGVAKSGDQENRRQKALERQKKKRFDAANYARKLADGELAEDDGIAENDGIDDSMEVENKSKKSKTKTKKSAYKNQLMLSEWLVEAPDDLGTNWVMMLAPVGRRVLVVANRGHTSAYAKNGYCLNKFPSLLPGGSFKSWRNSAVGSYTILDCIFDEGNRTYWILDLMCYKGVSFYENEMDFRLFWIHTKLQEDCPTLQHQQPVNPYKFIPCPYVPCIANDMINLIDMEKRFVIDGTLFYHRQCQYTPGRSPLVGWLKPYMFPLILHMPLHLMQDTPEQVNKEVLLEANRKLQNTTKDSSPLKQNKGGVTPLDEKESQISPPSSTPIDAMETIAS